MIHPSFLQTDRIHGLYGITPEWDDTDELVRAVQLAARHGLRVLQLRRKQCQDAHRRSQAIVLRDLCQQLGLVFLVNDDWRLALDVGADGAHLGKDDGDLRQARQAAGADFLLGASCYNQLAYVQQALAAGADHVALGALFVSPTKPEAVHAPLSCVTEVRRWLDQEAARTGHRVPLVAIGGITPENAAQARQAGADAIAVISALFSHPDLAAQAERFVQALSYA